MKMGPVWRSFDNVERGVRGVGPYEGSEAWNVDTNCAVELDGCG